MISLYRGQVVNSASPALSWACVDDYGMLQEAVSLSFVLSPAGSSSSIASVVFDDAALLLNRLSKGRYCLPLTVPANAAVGYYDLRVSWSVHSQTTTGEDYIKSSSARRTIEVTTTDLGLDGSHLCLLAFLREEGITVDMMPDRRAARLLMRCSNDIEAWTKVHFGSRYRQLRLDRQQGRMVTLGEPIVAIEKMESSAMDLDMTINRLAIYNSPFIVYNRHVSVGLKTPDDRQNPHLVLGGTSYSGYQTLVLTGLFGYTDYDGTCEGEVPLDIQEVCARLVWRSSSTIASEDDDAKVAPFVASESTSRQSVSYDARRIGDGPTGDRAIDDVLARYRPPLSVRMV